MSLDSGRMARILLGLLVLVSTLALLASAYFMVAWYRNPTDATTAAGGQLAAGMASAAAAIAVALFTFQLAKSSAHLATIARTESLRNQPVVLVEEAAIQAIGDGIISLKYRILNGGQHSTCIKQTDLSITWDDGHTEILVARIEQHTRAVANPEGNGDGAPYAVKAGHADWFTVDFLAAASGRNPHKAEVVVTPVMGTASMPATVSYRVSPRAAKQHTTEARADP